MKVGMISVVNGEDAGKTFLLKNLSVFEGGRSQGNHVLLRDPTVAMSHFRDCRNGTFVNGEPCEKAILGPGDVIRAGDVEMRFDMVDEGTPGRLASCAPEIAELDGGVERVAVVTEVPQPPADVAPEPVNHVQPLVGSNHRAVLEMVEGDEKGRVYDLRVDGDFVIGRSTSANIRLRDSKVSRAHCLVSLVGDHYIVQDNGSSNGTVVNGEKVKKTVLKDGDYVRLGFTILRFKFSAEVSG